MAINCGRLAHSHLGSRAFFVGGRYSIADIGLFTYTHVAEEGGFDLANFSAIRQWIKRIQAQPGYVELGWPVAVLAKSRQLGQKRGGGRGARQIQCLHQRRAAINHGELYEDATVR
jgi:hypothetical protein